MYQLFCASCHDIGQGARHRTGPFLNGLIGRRVGHHDEFISSLPMVLIGIRDVFWTEELLDLYMIEPSMFMAEEMDLPRTSFSPIIGLPDAVTRADIIAYIASHSGG